MPNTSAKEIVWNASAHPIAGSNNLRVRLEEEVFLLKLIGKERMTIFLNSHDLDEVQRICSKIAILQRGASQGI